MNVLPFFRTTHSLQGRSLLTLEKAAPITDDAPISIFSICKEHKLDSIYLYERDINGLLCADEQAKKHNVKLRFGVEVDIEGQRLGLFLLSTEGYSLFCQLLSQIYTNPDFKIDDIARYWNLEYFKMVVPYFDSFLYNNMLTQNPPLAPPNIKKFNPTFLICSMDLPYDHIFIKKIEHYCNQNEYKTQYIHPIYYYKREDVEALITYRVITRRKYSSQRGSLANPNLEMFCSDKFCWQEYEEKYLLTK